MNQESKKSSIEKALDIMNCFNDQHPYRSLEEISEETKIPKTTVFRTLTYLEDYGYIKKVPHLGKHLYSLGYTFLAKSELVKTTNDIRDLARNEMVMLRNITNLTVQLAIREEHYAVYIEQVESWRPIRVYPSIGKKAPLHLAACPRVLLAYLENDEQSHLLEKLEYDSHTDHTPIQPTVIQEHLTEIRHSGFSISKGELFEGTMAIAVPVINTYNNETIAALSIIGVNNDFDKEVDKYVTLLKETSAKISSKLTI